ncbi:hypothetical protein Ahy_A01g002260 isoform D [Arachis hypogaea]|uniref:Uncharacterized protein n=1 Tax=Arachis hypogaea TaxID=3818 RepID=A0A445EQD4_ARAHY|nr:hypothetical protein Ahy_A01g002260 isoform D [Arachis hypogaea]
MLYLNKFGSLIRKKLSDITNSSHHLQEQQKPPEDTTSNSADKDCIQQLLKERMTLLKLLAEKKKNLLLFSLIKIGNSKIIEWTKAEMQMLRGNVQKLQLQNWNLAKSNTHMLALMRLLKLAKMETLLEGYTPNDGKVIVVDKVLPAVPDQADVAKMAFRTSKT